MKRARRKPTSDPRHEEYAAVAAKWDAETFAVMEFITEAFDFPGRDDIKAVVALTKAKRRPPKKKGA